ncbi:MAG TPA: anthranilate phosphoribosyltransferase, partial [Acidimicrobiales bacterium]|nr:anthranilate phosphoribosyltransferase [Acidimicrobiales bacterium]
MIAQLLARLVARHDLTREEAMRLADMFVSGEATDAQVGAALVALAMKGETPEELAGLAEAMRARATFVRTRHRVFVDTAGTGGDGSGTFNISTAAAFVIAAAGLPVAKHGNRAASSRSGSADVLGALGARIEVPADDAGRCLDELGICFLFAPFYHAATRRVAEVRRQLGLRTPFNLLGPLTNPARAPRQLIGVGFAEAIVRVAAAAAGLGV